MTKCQSSISYIRQHSLIYRRDGLTDYQKRMNKASKELCLNNSHLNDCNLLMTEARKRVHESGYTYKKGRSRSKTLNPDSQEEEDK